VAFQCFFVFLGLGAQLFFCVVVLHDVFGVNCHPRSCRFIVDRDRFFSFGNFFTIVAEVPARDGKGQVNSELLSFKKELQLDSEKYRNALDRSLC